MVLLETVRGLVEQRWSETFLEGPTSYAGSGLNDDRLPSWAELWVTTSDDRVGRRTSPGRMDVAVTVHLFVRDASDPRRAERMVDGAKAALCPFDIDDGSVRVSLREVSIRDLSREQIEQDQRWARHVVVLVRGLAEEVCAG